MKHIMTPKITVIMPTFNRANLIEQSIESVLIQTFEDFEFLILDDGSTDNTKEVIQKYLKDPRVKYLYHENQGEAQTVNLGWSLAKGEYFTQVNSDDTITSNSFEVMVKEMDKHSDCIVGYPDFNFIDENNNIISTTKSPDWDFKEALSDFSCYAASAGTFIRREPLKNLETIKRSRFKHINDIEMYWDFALIGNFLHVDKVLANWRVHSGQISSNRYQAIPEIEEWYKYYFSKDNLPKRIVKLKDKTRKSILNYFILLINKSDLDKETKKQMQKPYKEELGIKIYDFNSLQIGDNDLIGNKFNGHDLQRYLREKNIEANHIVKIKKSTDENTYRVDGKFTDAILKSSLFASADIVHFHLIHNTDYDLTYLPVYSALKPTVITLHDPFFTTGHCIYSFGCEKWKTGCKDCTKLDIPFKLDIDTTALNYKIKKDSIQNSNICAIVASDYMENLVKQSPIWKGKKIYKLPFGINQEIFKPANKIQAKKLLGIDKDDIVIMFRATDYVFKGIDTIKTALKNLKTDKKITIITVQQKGLLKEFKHKFKIKEYGWVYDDDKLAQLYQASDLFLMPSEQEAFGMMAIEAMSCGVPVLSIKGTSLESVTNAPECGLCPDKKDFSQALNQLINNPEELNLRAEKSYNYARENYNKDIYIERMIAIYKDIIQNHSIDYEWKIVLEQMQQNAIKNYYAETTVPFARNFFWRKFYKFVLRPLLKIKYGNSVKKFDRIYFQ